MRGLRIYLSIFSYLMGAIVLLAPFSDAQVVGKKKNKAAEFIAQGAPEINPKGKATVYYLWHTNGAWHLRTTTDGTRHHFEGSIEVTSGSITNLKAPNLEKSGKNSDRLVLNKAGNAIAIDFTTDGGVDGINFKVSQPTAFLTFNLKIDEKTLPAHVFIGKNMLHPASNPFTLAAAP